MDKDNIKSKLEFEWDYYLSVAVTFEKQGNVEMKSYAEGHLHQIRNMQIWLGFLPIDQVYSPQDIYNIIKEKSIQSS